MSEAAKAFGTPAKMDDDSQAAVETKRNECVQELEDDRGTTIESTRERLGRIPEDPKGTQEQILRGLDRFEPGGAEWDDELSKNNSEDYRQSYAQDSTVFPQLTPLQVLQRKLKRSKLWKNRTISSIALSIIIRVMFG